MADGKTFHGDLPGWLPTLLNKDGKENAIFKRLLRMKKLKVPTFTNY
jgi:hypothetical protein